FPSGCQMSVRQPAVAAGVVSDFLIGLNTDPLTDQNYTSLDYAFELYFDGTNYFYYAYESSALVIGTTAAAANDVYSIKYDNQWVRYYRNGVLVRETF